MVLFGDNVAIGDELEAWRLWHSRQPSYKQRILDVGLSVRPSVCLWGAEIAGLDIAGLDIGGQGCKSEL